MAAKNAASSGPTSPTPHTSGLYADMTLDGPEIGTLVVVFDRAKNLPNRKTMGKQNPYCAARLGKEAKKTETDRRGGQTPRWDQELRFIVHESPDYHKIKISVFSEDKRTDLVGEAWIDLTQVIVPGGGKNDLWQTLTFKGKYAGELRIELTYYDERPKPSEIPVGQDFSQVIGGVKRRPLPSNPHLRNLTPDTIPDPTPPGRAKHGPRDFRTPPRPSSMPPEVSHAQANSAFHPPSPLSGHPQGSSPASQPYYTPPQHSYGMYEEPQSYQDVPYHQPDFLPQLPPSNRSHGSSPVPPRLSVGYDHSSTQLGLQHSYSSPAIPLTQSDLHRYDDGSPLRAEYPPPMSGVEYQHQQLETRPRTSDTFPRPQSGPPAAHGFGRPYLDNGHPPPPPPPPVHSNSSPAVSQRSIGHPISSPVAPYGSTPPSARHYSYPDSSPLPSIERKYVTPPHPHGQGSSPTRGMSLDLYTPSPEQRAYGSSPSGHLAGQSPSPFARQQVAPRTTPSRHSIADPYLAGTPPRPHPLSQEVSQTHSPPQPPGPSPQTGNTPAYPTQYRSRDGLPLIKPRPVSPQAASQPSSQPNSATRSRSAYDIQFPVRSFESSDNSPLSTSQPNRRVAQLSNPTTPMRNSMPPQATPPHSAGAVPYSPDSFSIHNPNAQAHALATTVPNGNSPHSPYKIRPGSEAMPLDEPNGPIVDSHGNEVDPSDRLPIHSWAPEPEKKTPNRTYGLGRDRDFGPRSPQSAENIAGKSVSKDTVVSVRQRAQHQSSPAEPTPGRNRLQKKSNAAGKGSATQPLQERHNYNSMPVPNPYEQHDYDAGFHGQSYEHSVYTGSYAAMSEDALSREISSIDIGGTRQTRSGSVPAPTAYVPVMSQKDRRTFY